MEVHATTVNRTDCGFRAPWPWFIRLFAGLRRPKRTILGSEFAGVVAEVGSAVTEFAVGDEVFGVNADRFGAHAEYLCVRERAPIAPKPSGTSFEEAAAVCDGAILAMTCLSVAEAPSRAAHPRSTEHPGRSARPASSWPSTSAPTSPLSATPPTSRSCDRSAPTRSSTTPSRTSRRTARPTTSSSTPSARSRSPSAKDR